jgi:hypothetical protein
VLIQYHESITRTALGERLSSRALQAVIAANLHQDNLLTGQIGHNEYHYDNNTIAKSDGYITEQRRLILPALQNNNPPAAWAAFGRLAHTAQDFYAHTNYVDLWLSRFRSNGHMLPTPSEIAPLIVELVRSPELHSGKLYYPWEVLAFIPGLQRIVIPLLPADSHARMHLDSPAQGERFAYAFEAAVKRTLVELHETVAGLTSEEEALFTDLR